MLAELRPDGRVAVASNVVDANLLKGHLASAMQEVEALRLARLRNRRAKAG